MAFNSIQEVTDALARGEINATEATTAINSLQTAGEKTIRLKTGDKGTCSVKAGSRTFPLASLYADEWEVLLDPANVEKILTYINSPSNGVKRKNR